MLTPTTRQEKRIKIIVVINQRKINNNFLRKGLNEKSKRQLYASSLKKVIVFYLHFATWNTSKRCFVSFLSVCINFLTGP